MIFISGYKSFIGKHFLKHLVMNNISFNLIDLDFSIDYIHNDLINYNKVEIFNFSYSNNSIREIGFFSTLFEICRYFKIPIYFNQISTLAAYFIDKNYFNGKYLPYERSKFMFDKFLRDCHSNNDIFSFKIIYPFIILNNNIWNKDSITEFNYKQLLNIKLDKLCNRFLLLKHKENDILFFDSSISYKKIPQPKLISLLIEFSFLNKHFFNLTRIIFKILNLNFYFYRTININNQLLDYIKDYDV